jgi:hypothetical protein
MDSFNPKKVFQAKSLKLEVTGMLYNLVIVYLKLGAYMLSSR